MGSLAHWRQSVKDAIITNDAVRGLVCESHIHECCREVGHCWRASFWDPGTTLVAFLLQVLDGSKTLRAAVAVLLTHWAARGHMDLPSADPAAYCQARQRLPVEVLERLLSHVAEGVGHLVSNTSRWLGHRVWVVDGSNVSMPDTADLQAAFPQPESQKRGCGFPMAQIVALFCWTTGAIEDVIIDCMRPHEITLFRKLWPHFGQGDVVLADRAFGSYVDVARLRERHVMTVCRLHQRRKADFRTGQRLGPDDRLMQWVRPKQWRPSTGISQEEFQELPQAMTVRHIRITQAPPGFRSRTIVVVTTLLDPVAYPADDIRALYRDRWTAELNFRSLKTNMGMEILRGHSVDVVRKEILMHLIGYNLIRILMWQAAREHGRDLHRLSFTGTLHRLRVHLPLLILQRIHTLALFSQLVLWIAEDTLPDRPDRIEPRRVKRRPKTYSRLTKPRALYKRRTGDIDRDAR